MCPAIVRACVSNAECKQFSSHSLLCVSGGRSQWMMVSILFCWPERYGSQSGSRLLILRMPGSCAPVFSYSLNLQYILLHYICICRAIFYISFSITHYRIIYQPHTHLQNAHKLLTWDCILVHNSNNLDMYYECLNCCLLFELCTEFRG